MGRNADVLLLTGGLLRDAPDLEEAHYWCGRALGWEAESITALQRALKLRPGYTAARAALARLSG